MLRVKNSLNLVVLNNLINYYMIFMSYFIVNYLLSNTFNFFNRIFINYNFFEYFNLLNNKKAYLFYYIMFKKQNSLMKKKYNLFNNLYPVYFRKKIRKKITSTWNYSLYNYSNAYIYKFLNVLSGKKKYRKTILLNRLFFNYLNFNRFKTSTKLSNNISINSKLIFTKLILKLEYSLMYLITNTNIVKSYKDLCKFLSLSYIYLNRKAIFRDNIVLNSGDIIEFNLNYKLFNYINKFKEFNNKYIYKLRTKLWFKIKNYNRMRINYNDTKITNALLKNNILFKNSIPNYLEIDYITLSIVILYKSLDYKHYNYVIKKLLVVYMFKLYNWK